MLKIITDYIYNNLSFLLTLSQKKKGKRKSATVLWKQSTVFFFLFTDREHLNALDSVS